jgi:hypothetical protein
VLGGIVSIVGIGTLALFSGLITVGFLDQLKTRREQPQSQRAIGEQDSEAVLSFDGVVVPGPLNGICPRCGYGPLELEAARHKRTTARTEGHKDIHTDDGIVDH